MALPLGYSDRSIQRLVEQELSRTMSLPLLRQIRFQAWWEYPAVASTPWIQTILQDCIYEYQTLSAGQACSSGAQPLPATCTGRLPFSGPTSTAPPSSTASVVCSNTSLEDGDGLCTYNVGTLTFTTFTPSGGPGNSCRASTIVPLHSREECIQV